MVYVQAEVSAGGWMELHSLFVAIMCVLLCISSRLFMK